MKNNIIIVGAFHEIIELAEKNGFNIVGLIDNKKQGEYYGYRIISSDENIPIKYKKYPLIISPDLQFIRGKLFEYYKQLGFAFTCLISNEAKISKNCTIQKGTIIQYGVHISAECKIGQCVRINTYANIMHDTQVSDFCTIAPNAVILGKVHIGMYCYIGSNSTILPSLKIANFSVIGAGAVVTKDVPAYSIVAGNPARVLKQFQSKEEMENYFRSKQKLQ